MRFFNTTGPAVLRQLRAGYDDRPGGFPQSVILCGVRNVRDYRIHSSVEKTIITGGSAFNVKAASLRIGDFSEAEVRALLGQHTDETGQRFAEAARQAVWELAGQPWLVNALAQEACFADAAGRDRSRAITAEAIHAARERIILRRETHLDQLTDKLQEERVRRVIGPLLSGSEAGSGMRPTTWSTCATWDWWRAIRRCAFANPVYREVIPARPHLHHAAVPAARPGLVPGRPRAGVAASYLTGAALTVDGGRSAH